LRAKRFVKLGLVGAVFWAASAASAATLGYTGTGNTAETFAGSIRGSLFLCGRDFSGACLAVHIADGPADGHVRAAVYGTTHGEPDELLAESEAVPVVAKQWIALPLTHRVAVTAGQAYLLCLQFETAAGVSCLNLAVVNSRYVQAAAWGPFPDHWSAPSAGSGATYSIYLTDSIPEPAAASPTAGAAPTLTPAPPPAGTPSPAGSPTTCPSFFPSPHATVTPTPTPILSPAGTRAPRRSITPLDATGGPAVSVTPPPRPLG